MTEMLAPIGIAVAAFVATNIDDLLLLVIFFANPSWHPRSIVMGQLAGMAALIAGSMAIAQLAVVASPRWIAVLGFFPLILGLSQLRAVVRGQSDSDADDFESQGRYRHRQVLAVAGVTLANGGDNLGVYVPLFARTPAAIAEYAIVFMSMTLLWLALAHGLVRHPLLGQRIRRYGHLLSPLMLIALGIGILEELL